MDRKRTIVVLVFGGWKARHIREYGEDDNPSVEILAEGPLRILPDLARKALIEQTGADYSE